MEKVEYLQDLEVGEFVLLKNRKGDRYIVVKLDSDESEIKGRYVKTQYPYSGSAEFLSQKDWDNYYYQKFKVSGSCDWGKEYSEI
jgi:hypothetical protein